MSAEGSITAWVDALRVGDDQDAACQLWGRYFHRLKAQARRVVGNRPGCGAYDEEDVALSAFDVFCRGMREGKFAELSDRDALWRLLVVITVRKARDRGKAELAQKRGGGRKSLDNGELTEDEFDGLLSREPDPQFSAAMEEQCRQLLDGLNDDELKRVAVMRLDGYSNAEIADDLCCTRQTVQRRLRLIRQIWESA